MTNQQIVNSIQALQSSVRALAESLRWSSEVSQEVFIELERSVMHLDAAVRSEKNTMEIVERALQ